MGMQPDRHPQVSVASGLLLSSTKSDVLTCSDPTALIDCLSLEIILHCLFSTPSPLRVFCDNTIYIGIQKLEATAKVTVTNCQVSYTECIICQVPCSEKILKKFVYNFILVEKR